MLNWLKNLLSGNGSQAQPEKKEPEAKKENTSTQAAGAPAELFSGLEGIRFGRYSDNNKSYVKTQNWYKAEDRFKEKRYKESFDAFFEYIKDDREDNITFNRSGDRFEFTIYQGSKKVYGDSDGKCITARVPLASMTEPSTAVMRRMLEMNYTLYYSRSAMSEDNVLYMVFDTPVASATPSKLYYGLRELATKADRQDDLLIADFDLLKAVDTGHVQYLSERELDIKYNWYRKWITETLERIEKLNQDSFSGAIAYSLLVLIYRIDFLISPEATLMTEIEKINSMYWEKKDEISLVERNQMMKEGVRRLLEMPKEEFRKYVYRSKGTFAITSPPKMNKVRDHIVDSNKDAKWYTENNYEDLALALNEYGMLYNQFIYSMPEVLTNLVRLYMSVMHAAYFAELGLKTPFYKGNNQFDKERIESTVNKIIESNKDKYTKLKWDHESISYKSLYDFGVSFSDELAHLNMETKR